MAGEQKTLWSDKKTCADASILPNRDILIQIWQVPKFGVRTRLNKVRTPSQSNEPRTEPPPRIANRTRTLDRTSGPVRGSRFGPRFRTEHRQRYQSVVKKHDRTKGRCRRPSIRVATGGHRAIHQETPKCTYNRNDTYLRYHLYLPVRSGTSDVLCRTCPYSYVPLCICKTSGFINQS